MTRHTLKTTLELYGLDERGRSLKVESPQRTIDDQSFNSPTVLTTAIATLTFLVLLALTSSLRTSFAQPVSIGHEGQESGRLSTLRPRAPYAADRVL